MRYYCVVFQTGGTHNAPWHRSVAMSHSEAVKCAATVKRMGYLAMVVSSSVSRRHNDRHPQRMP